jgi:hypothetical protein
VLQILYPGFDADVLWKFRWYSILNQLLIWTTIGLTFGTLLERLTGPVQPSLTPPHPANPLEPRHNGKHRPAASRPGPQGHPDAPRAVLRRP